MTRQAPPDDLTKLTKRVGLLEKQMADAAKDLGYIKGNLRELLHQVRQTQEQEGGEEE